MVLPLSYALASVVVVSLISLVGILTISLNDAVLRKLLPYLVSFSAGALFGYVFIHMLPEIAEPQGLAAAHSAFILLGIVVFFVVEKFIQWRHRDRLGRSAEHIHSFAFVNLIGDGVHNFVDGLIIGATYLVSIPLGVATTVAVVLHEIPQEIGDFGVLVQGGFTKARAVFYNLLVALTSIAGALVAFAVGSAEVALSSLIPFAAGGFVYIAGSDLIPELRKETAAKKSILQLLSFLAGIGVMAALP